MVLRNSRYLHLETGALRPNEAFGALRKTLSPIEVACFAGERNPNNRGIETRIVFPGGRLLLGIYVGIELD